MAPGEDSSVRGTGSPAKAGSPAPGTVRTVRLPEEVVRALEIRMKGSSFESVDMLIAFILGRLVDHAPGDTAFSEEDERLLKDRLRSLGYID
ncbi:MAG: hypothetical protein WB789_05315 [Thermoplasmata archaeon]